MRQTYLDTSMKNNPKYIICHCTDYPRSKMPDQFLACNNWHKDREFPLSSLGYYIGYHRLITGEKNYQARLDNDEGAHCNQQVNGLSLNFQSLGVCVGFDGDIEPLTSMEYALLQKQVWDWQDLYKIPNENVKFHRFYATEKTCPGSLITDAWLKTLLTRPVVVTNISLKPIENMCISQEMEIKELKAKITWFQEIFNWITEKWS